jgi:hypothetical protein
MCPPRLSVKPAPCVTGTLIRTPWDHMVTKMSSRTRLSGPISIILSLLFGLLMIQFQQPLLFGLSLNIIFPFIALGVFVVISMSYSW